MITVNLDEAGIRTMMKQIESPVNNGEKFFKNLGSYLHQQTQITFETKGARGGHEAWADYKVGTLHPVRKKHGEKIGYDLTKWNRRTGTDGAKSRKYSEASKMLQASGSFKKSFRVLAVNKYGIAYGSNYIAADGKTTAKDIAGEREVLFITDMDKQNIQAMFKGFVEQSYRNEQ